MLRLVLRYAKVIRCPARGKQNPRATNVERAQLGNEAEPSLSAQELQADRLSP
jgi:hypothetical protein